jgi:hypothetical protein
MKQCYTFLLLFFVSIFGQAQITFQGCATGDFGPILGDFPAGNPQTYELEHVPSQNVGARNTYISSLTQSCGGLGGGFCPIRIIWAGSQWEIQLDAGSDGSFQASNIVVIYYNTSASTPNPPSLNLGTWEESQAFTGVPGLCGGTPPTILSGDVQDGETLGSHLFTLEALEIYPNPVNDKLTVQLNQQVEYLNITLYDMLGKQVKHFSFNNLSQSIINLEDLPKGIYVLEATSGSQSKVLRLIKQ